MPIDIPKQQIHIGLNNTTALTCDECGNDTFIDVLYLRKVSKLLTGSPEDQLVPIPAYACSKCHHVNTQFKLRDAEEPKPANPIILPAQS